VILAIFAAIKSAPAQGGPEREGKRERPKLSLEGIELRANLASVNDPESVRALTDEILARSPVASAPESLKDRLHRAELAFRRGAQAPVSEADLASRLNEEVDHSMPTAKVRIPSYMRTSEDQIRTVRTFVRRFVPDLVKTSDGAPEPMGKTKGMSPAEMAFVTISLIHQKLINPEYQVSPEEWEQQSAARRQAAESAHWTISTPVPAPTLTAHVRRASGLWVSLDLGEEGGASMHRVHAFLDALGIEQ